MQLDLEHAYFGLALALVMALATILVRCIVLRRSKVDIFDGFVAKDKNGDLKPDFRKFFEFGSFMSSTWLFMFWPLIGKFDSAYAIGYMATWTTARYLRDREQRLREPINRELKDVIG
jgi:hypothetical protein